MRCTVKRNGVELPEIGDFTSTPGQYVHVDLRPIPQQEVQLKVDEIFGIESATSGYNRLEVPASTYFSTIANGDAQEVVSMHNIRTMDHADYWIFMAALLWPTTLILMKSTYKKPQRPRLVHRPRCFGRKQLRGLLLASLILSAHGLSLQHRIAQFSVHDEYRHTVFTEETSIPTDLYVRDPFEHTTPPGNTVSNWLQLTPTGFSMLQMICDRLTDHSKFHNINLHKALGFDEDRQKIALVDALPEATCTVCTDRPVSPILPIAATQTVDEPVSFRIDDTPESKGASLNAFHLPDRDPSPQALSSCKFPFRDIGARKIFLMSGRFLPLWIFLEILTTPLTSSRSLRCPLSMPMTTRTCMCTRMDPMTKRHKNPVGPLWCLRYINIKFLYEIGSLILWSMNLWILCGLVLCKLVSEVQRRQPLFLPSSTLCNAITPRTSRSFRTHYLWYSLRWDNGIYKTVTRLDSIYGRLSWQLEPYVSTSSSKFNMFGATVE